MFDSFGLDISDGSLKYAYMKRGLFGDRIAAFGEARIPSGLIVNGEIKDRPALSRIIHDALATAKILPRFVVVSLPDSKTFIKLLTVTATEHESIKAAIERELSNHIPIPIDQLVYDYSFVDSAEHTKSKRKESSSGSLERNIQTRVLVAACDSHSVKEYGTMIREAGYHPVAFEIEVQATARAILSKSDVSNDINKATVVIDWGETQATIMFFAGGTLVFSASSNISGREVTRKIAEKLSLDIEKAEQAKLICGLDPKKCKGVVKQYLEEYIGKLGAEVRHGLEYYTTHIAPQGSVGSVFLVGGGSNLKNFDLAIEHELGINIAPQYGDVFRNVPAIRNAPDLPPSKRVSFATAVGLAMRANT